MTDRVHERGHDTAAAIGREHPHWLVMWGVWSREYWAFPMLAVPQGTLVHAPDPGMLAAAMAEVEISIQHRPAMGWAAHQPDTEGKT